MNVMLDSGVLGFIIHPNSSATTEACSAWLENLLLVGHEVYIPEIVDYESRRKLVHLNSEMSLSRLDRLELVVNYLPLTTRAMRRASELWANARRAGVGAAADNTLDIDMILAAQAQLLAISTGRDTVIATTNVRHLARFTDARLWPDIP